ncbi:MAG: hypothetical protein A2Y67_01750 [Candidatus Buchananbacteria bacterium RBG_13_39_9]|uniref:Uncharacterized protein n=1 Tax=Candidatus Buchananbacteria bacterium RBG_13_39_9 TaxID=1797531 RepID=A0A1G1XQH4_9BACT|nr:MAG: hypothetical protein A2Y67_01750 [Candidatus Buchananbacteria bacterium RBG_13_39_9]
MSVNQRIARIKNLGTLIVFSIMSGLNRSFTLDEITYEIVSRIDCPEGVFLKIENNHPVVCGKSLAEIKNFFRQFGINELPGQLPCQPHCFQCDGGCLARAA